MKGYGGPCFHWTRTSYSQRDGPYDDVGLYGACPGAIVDVDARSASRAAGVSTAGRRESRCGSGGKPCVRYGAVRRRTGAVDSGPFRFPVCGLSELRGRRRGESVVVVDRGSRPRLLPVLRYAVSQRGLPGKRREAGDQSSGRDPGVSVLGSALSAALRNCRDHFLISNPIRSTFTISGPRDGTSPGSISPMRRITSGSSII